MGQCWSRNDTASETTTSIASRNNGVEMPLLKQRAMTKQIVVETSSSSATTTTTTKTGSTTTRSKSMLSGYTSEGIVIIPQCDTDPLSDEDENHDSSKVKIMNAVVSPSTRFTKADIERMIDEANGDNSKVLRQLMLMRQQQQQSTTKTPSKITPRKGKYSNFIESEDEAPSDEDIATQKKAADDTCNTKVWQEFKNIQQEIFIKTPKQSKATQSLRSKTPQSQKRRKQCCNKKGQISDSQSQSSKQSFQSWRKGTAATTRNNSIGKQRKDKKQTKSSMNSSTNSTTATNRSILSERSLEANRKLNAGKQQQYSNQAGSLCSKKSRFSTPSIDNKSSSLYSYGDESTDYGPVRKTSTQRRIRTGGHGNHLGQNNCSTTQQRHHRPVDDCTDTPMFSFIGLEVVFSSPGRNGKDEKDFDDLSTISDLNDETVNCESQYECSAANAAVPTIQDYGPVHRTKTHRGSSQSGLSHRDHSRSIQSSDDDIGSSQRICHHAVVYNYEEIIQRRMDIEAKLKALLNEDDCDDLTEFLSAGPGDVVENSIEDDVKENVVFLNKNLKNLSIDASTAGPKTKKLPVE